MRISLVLTGKTREKYLQEGFELYRKRLDHYVPFSCTVIPDLKVTKKTGNMQVQEMEGDQILQRIKPGDFVVLLDERGKHYSSEEFAAYLQSMEGRTGHILFIVGGAYGFSEAVYNRADHKMSLSKMTFSHQMVRLLFVEQLYRAYTILNGEPYHHK